MNTQDRVLLEKILDDTGKISKYIQGLDRDSFLENDTVQDAVMMCLIRIGERANHLTEIFCKANNHIPWNRIYRLRNKAAHEYEALRMADIWVNVIKDVPDLQLEIVKILEKDK